MSITPNVIRVIAEGEWAPATGLVCGVPDDAKRHGVHFGANSPSPRSSYVLADFPASNLAPHPSVMFSAVVRRAKTRKPRLRKQTQYIKQKNILKKRIYILLFTLLLLVAGPLSVSAQIVDAEGQYVDTVFNDHVDRTAEDFVIASLLVADPGTVLYSVLGHACIRLQCPTFDMDYCFSYESEGVKNRVLDFLAGKLMMGLFAIPVEEYCAPYKEDGRGVYEYKLNLPIQVKRELWRILDEKIAEGHRLPYDYYHRGCAITIVDFVKQALGETVIVYDRSLYEFSPTGRDLVKTNTTKALWVRFVACFISGNDVDKPLVGDKQLLIPADLVSAWQKAKVNGGLVSSLKKKNSFSNRPIAYRNFIEVLKKIYTKNYF